jgi:predicted  nucleic acid-binding Zn-ribbon protein
MNEVEKFLSLQKKIDDLSQTKIRVEERYKAEKAKLENLLKEIESKGYNPKDLSSIKAKLEQELKDGVASLEKEVKDLTDKLIPLEDASK